MEGQSSRMKLFCADQSPVQPSKYIFDKTYTNVCEKKKFQKDPKFAYYNTLIKMKNNYRQRKNQLYSYIFEKQTEQVQEVESFQSYTPKQAWARGITPRKTFHVEKINNHAFKIYKDKRMEKSLSHKLSQNIELMNDINFKVHFRGKNREPEEKPKIELLLHQYRKLQETKSRVNPQRDLESRSKRRSTGTNFAKKQLQAVPVRKNLSATHSNRFLNASKANKNRANMSQLAFRILN